MTMPKTRFTAQFLTRFLFVALCTVVECRAARSWAAEKNMSEVSNERSSISLLEESADPVAFSSQRMAAARAIENKRRDRLFEDKVSQYLAGQALEVAKQKMKTEKGYPRTRNISIRTKYFDDFLEHVSVEHGIEQIVLVGAGMDTRAFRLALAPQLKEQTPKRYDWLWRRGKNRRQLTAGEDSIVSVPSRCFYEVDQEKVLEEKEKLMALLPRKLKLKHRRKSVYFDLTNGNFKKMLLESGFDPTMPSVWILEGLSMYLSEAQNIALLEQIASLCLHSASFVGLSFVNTKAVENAQNSQSPLMQQWVFGTDSLGDLLSKLESPPKFHIISTVNLGDPGGYPTGASYHAYARRPNSAYTGGQVTYALLRSASNQGKYT
uniref:Uncharacterized protein n=1 Tax=Heterosigma akashiwo TaxID=2829 RepID=A0A7S3UT74_HETAK